MVKAAKTALWIMLGLFVLSIALGGGYSNPFDNVVAWLGEPGADGSDARIVNLFVIGGLLFLLAKGITAFKKSATDAFGKKKAPAPKKKRRYYEEDEGEAH